jgi:hypothetical protein
MNRSRSTSAPAQTYPGACDRDPIPDHVDHFMGPGHNDLTIVVQFTQKQLSSL